MSESDYQIHRIINELNELNESFNWKLKIENFYQNDDQLSWSQIKLWFCVSTVNV